ncbi:MAG: methionyl-tRNA formyltransferase [bacterium]
MQIVYFGNNKLSVQILEWLLNERENTSVMGLVHHPPDDGDYVSDLLELVNSTNTFTFNADETSEEELKSFVHHESIRTGISVLYGKILSKTLLEAFDKGVFNLHPAYLPYNRGAYPNVWSLYDDTPAGVTIHKMDEGIDTGDIVVQRKVDKEPTDTGKSLYKKLMIAAKKLFVEHWPDIELNNYSLTPQDPEAGTYHERSDVEEIDEIDLDKEYTARELINRLRARTFPPHDGVYFTEDGRRINCTIDLEYGDEADNDSIG